MIDRLAKVLIEAEAAWWHRKWDADDDPTKEPLVGRPYDCMAEAVFAFMREPTAEMLAAINANRNQPASLFWYAVLDAMIAPADED